jgi:hypothetical protein
MNFNILIITLIVCSSLVAWRLIAVYRSWAVGRVIAVVALFLYSTVVTFGATAIPRFAVIEARQGGSSGSFIDGVGYGSSALTPIAVSVWLCILSFFVVSLFAGKK